MNGTLATVLGLSLGGTLMALLLYGIKLIFGKRLPSAFYYYAWLPVLLRFVLPLPGLLSLPSGGAEAGAETAQSAYYDAAEPEAASPRAAAQSAENTAVYAAADEPAQEQAAAAGADNADAEKEGGELSAALKALWGEVGIGGLLTAIWAAGAALCLALYALSYLRFRRALKRTLRPARLRDREVFRSIGGGRRPRLMRSGAVRTPMLVGIFSPVLVLPDGDYDCETLENILRHELTHYRRRDIAYKWFALLVYALHWFNPVLRLVRRELDRDCELSCDECLLRRMDESGKRSYGETLINLASNRTLPQGAVATTFATEKKNLKERLVQIMTYKKKSRGAMALMLALTLLLCACGAVSAPAGDSAAPTPDTAEAAEIIAGPAAVKTYANSVSVSTVDELLAAIAPDTEIRLEPGEYRLSAAANYGTQDGENYRWEPTSDGYRLVIADISNLAMIGGEGVVISTEPRYADVLSLYYCEDVYLEGLTVGHTEVLDEHCIGGVIRIDNGQNVVIDGCALYGCGTIGVDAAECNGIQVKDTEIYDCSERAASILSCYDVLFDGCEIHDCEVDTSALFNISYSREIAVINSSIHDNSALVLVASIKAEGMYLGGVSAENNELSKGVLLAGEYPIIVDGCTLGCAEDGNWFATPEGYYAQTDENAGAAAPDGTALDAETLAAMELRENVTWTAKTAETGAAPAAGEDGAVHVSTVDELLAAIAPDTAIYLEDGDYDLSTAANYGLNGGEYYKWNNPYDGPELVISGVDNLTIKAGGKDKVNILAVPRFANVLRFENCDALTLEGFTAGHTEEPGNCTGGVIYLDGCESTSIDGCGFFGCGVIGIWAYSGDGMSVTDTEIYECSDSAVSLHDCRNFSFDNCDIHDNGSDTIEAYSCENITADGKDVEAAGQPVAEPVATPAPELYIYYEGTAKEEDITLHVGDEAITLSAGFSAEDGDTGIEWLCSDEEALKVTSTGTNTCTVECLKAVKGGVKLMAKGGGAYKSITVYCLENG